MGRVEVRVKVIGWLVMASGRILSPNWTLYPSTTVEHTPPPSTHAFTTSAPAFSLAVPVVEIVVELVVELVVEFVVKFVGKLESNMSISSSELNQTLSTDQLLKFKMYYYWNV